MAELPRFTPRAGEMMSSAMWSALHGGAQVDKVATASSCFFCVSPPALSHAACASPHLSVSPPYMGTV